MENVLRLCTSSISHNTFSLIFELNTSKLYFGRAIFTQSDWFVQMFGSIMRENPNIGDAELLLLIKAGDQNAFKKIYERYWQLLYVAAFKILKDEDEAKDVVQEVFASFLNKPEDFTITTTLSAYLYTSVRYKVFDVLSKRKVRTSHEESIADYISQGNYSTDRNLIEQEIATIIEKEIDNLPPKMRKVFELSRNHELSYKEIADKLNISDKTVKKQINNALKILKPKFTNYYLWLILCLMTDFR